VIHRNGNLVGARLAAVLAALLLVPLGRSATAQDLSGWVGRQVVEKYREMQIQYNGQVVDTGDIHRIYRVTQVNGPWLWVVAPGAQGWVSSAEVVPVDSAVEYFGQQIRSYPRNPGGYISRALVECDLGLYTQALVDYYLATRVDPSNVFAANNLAWVMATCPNEEIRNGREALNYALDVNRRTAYTSAAQLDTLAAAYAELGNFGEAMRWQARAIAYSPNDQDLRDRLESYRQGKPCRYGVPGKISRADQRYIEKIFADFGIRKFAAIAGENPDLIRRLAEANELLNSHRKPSSGQVVDRDKGTKDDSPIDVIQTETRTKVGSK
jgi:tetratricopeptide (TPR) repeat protein